MIVSPEQRDAQQVLRDNACATTAATIVIYIPDFCRSLPATCPCLSPFCFRFVAVFVAVWRTIWRYFAPSSWRFLLVIYAHTVIILRASDLGSLAGHKLPGLSSFCWSSAASFCQSLPATCPCLSPFCYRFVAVFSAVLPTIWWYFSPPCWWFLLAICLHCDYN